MPSIRDLEANDPKILLQRISAEFPELSWTNYKFLNHGWDHEVIILDDKIVFRFPASSEYLPVLKDEIELLRYLDARIDFRMPQYEYTAKDKSFAGYKIIPGVELTEEVFGTLPLTDQRLIAEQLASFLTGLHTTPVVELRQFKVEDTDLKAEAQKLRAQTEQYLRPVLSKAAYNQALQVLTDFDAITNSSYSKALTHNDITPKHIIWDSATKVIGVIDFSDRAISDPAFDFTELFLYGKAFAEQVYAAYQGPKDNDFLRRAVVYLKRLGVYMLVDSFLTDKVTYEEAKRMYDRVIVFDQQKFAL